MSYPTVYAHVPVPVSAAYEAYREWCRASKFKIVNEDAQAYKIEFRQPLLGARFLAAFTAARDGEESNLALDFSGPFGRVDPTGQVRTVYIEPYLARVNKTMLAEAQSRLAGTSREQLLHGDQPVTAEAETLLRQLQNASLAFGRQEAIRGLGALPESNERIVAALLAARECDPHEDVRSEAANALKAPVHRTILDKDPDWAAQVAALGQLRRVDEMNAEQVSRTNERTGKHLAWRGIFVILLGLLSIAANLSGYTVMVWGVIPLASPAIGGIVILIGVAMIVLGNRGS